MGQQEKNTTIKELKNSIDLYKRITGDVIDYAKHLFIALTFHSTKIEGCSYDFAETKTLLEKNITANKDYISGNMIIDHFNALIYVVEQSDKKAMPDENTIKTVAGMVKKTTGNIYNNIFGTCDESKGDYRVNLVTVGSKTVTFPGPQKVNKLMRELVVDLQANMQKANTLEKKLKVAFKLHYDLVMIHPFSDGNGRTARLMMNYVLNYYDLPLFTIDSGLRADYIKTLEKTKETENLNVFYDFSKTAYNDFLNEQIGTIVKDKELLNMYRKQKNKDKGRSF